MSVYDDSNTAIVDGAAAAITGDVAEYTITAATLPSTLTLAMGWRVEWNLVVSTAERPDGVIRARNSAALVRWAWHPMISDVDVFRRVPALDPSSSTVITSATDYQGFIDEAATSLQRRLIASGNRPNLIMEPSALREPLLYLTLALIFEDLATRLSQAYEVRAQEFRAAYESAWQSLTFEYDTDDDGVADANTRAAQPTVSLCGGRDVWSPRLGGWRGHS